MHTFKWLKYIGITFAALLGIFVIGGYILISRVDEAHMKAALISVLEQHTGRKATINGNVLASFGLRPSLSVSDITLSNPKWIKKRDFLHIGSLSMQVDLSDLWHQKLGIEHITIKDGTINLQNNGLGMVNWELKPSLEMQHRNALKAQGQPVKEEPLPFSLQLATLNIENTKVHYFPDLHAAPITVQLQNLTLQDNQGIETTLNATFNGLNITAKALSTTLTDLQKGNAKINIFITDNKKLRINAEGKIAQLTSKSANFSLTTQFEGDSLAAFQPLFFPILPKIPESKFSAQLAGSPQAFRITQFKGKMGDTEMSGDGALNLQGKLPTIGANLHIPSITLPNVDKSRVSAEPPPHSELELGNYPLIPDRPLAFPVLSSWEADIKLAADAIYGDVTIEKLQTNIALHNNKLTLKPFSFLLNGIALSPYIEITNKERSVDFVVRAAGSQLPLGALLSSLGLSNRIEGGVTDFWLDIAGSGDTLHHALGSLDGNFGWHTESGSYRGGRVLSQASKWLDLLTGNTQSSEIPFTCFASHMRIAKGEVTPDWLTFLTPQARVDGEGTLTLSNQTQRLTLYPRLNAKDVQGVTIPVYVSGSFSQPSIRPDTNASIAMLAGIMEGINKKNSYAAQLSESLATHLSHATKPSPCLSAPPAVTPTEAIQNLKASVSTAKDNVKQDVKDVKEGLKKFKDSKDIKDIPLDKLKGLEKLF